jgi:hypothetical protein
MMKIYSIKMNKNIFKCGWNLLHSVNKNSHNNNNNNNTIIQYYNW